MKFEISTGVALLALALATTTVAFAQSPGATQSPTGAYIGGYQRSPGPYYGGTGSAQATPNPQYNQGSAQSLQPMNQQGAAEQTGTTEKKSSN